MVKMMQANKSHLVILLHGIRKTNSCLKGLEQFIQTHGFSVLNITYPSTKYSIGELADFINNITTNKIEKYKTVSFVGFSMGGLVIRVYLNKYKVPNLGKVVMVGTPNNGSEVADFLISNPLYKKLYGPAGLQLVTNQEKFKNLLGEVNYECGIIAGNLPLDFCYPIMRKKSSDGKVSVDSTKLKNMKDHIVLNVTHWYMPYSRTVWKYIVSFLKYSQFN